MVDYPFRQWLPDLPDLNNPGLVQAEGVWRSPSGYQPFSAPVSVDVTDDDWVEPSSSFLARGAHFHPGGTISADLPFTLMAGVGSLHMVSYTSSTYAVLDTQVAGSASGVWAFADYEKYAIACTPFGSYIADRDGGDTIQSYSQIGSARAVGRVGSFLLASDATGPGFRWSAFNNIFDFTPSQRTQSGEAILNTPELGYISAILGGRTPLIFQERGVTRISYVGAPVVWQTQLISSEFGVPSQGCVAQVDNLVYFVNANGVFVTNGAQITDVGYRRVSQWLQDNVTGTLANTMSAIDQKRGLIIWSFPGGTTAPDGSDYHLVYNYREDAFSVLTLSVGGLALMSADLGSDPPRLVAYTPSSGATGIAAFTGDALEAKLTTGHISNSGARISASSAEAHYSGSGATIALSGKDRFGAASDFGSYATPDTSTGYASVRAEGRALAASVKFASGADWDDFTGLTIDIGNGGKR